MLNEDLIRALTENCAPIRPLAHPALRALGWFAVSLCYVAAVVAMMGLRPDILAKIADPRFATEVGAAFLTSLVAAAGAFSAGCPARPIWERFAAGLFCLIWAGALVVGCWRDIAAFGLSGLLSHSDVYCLPTILAMSIPAAILILSMVKRGAPIAPFVTIGLAALASTALAAAALRLSFRQDAAVSVCIWQFGSVVLLTGLASLFGRVLLHWTLRDELIASFQGHRR
ncbi:MAG: NrsF family protein [Methylocystis sp.]|uniref:NrsF family protein n=1 Tax=Methylocystis sp. TaxID=1911079 RepID=UPI003D14B7BA